MPLVAPLRSFAAEDLALAGGKAANLGTLVRAGFPVPDGFVVTTEAYDEVLRSSDLHIAEKLDKEGAGAVRADLQAMPLPAELRDEIVGAYAELRGGPVAVRSSATAEDLPGAAFAGQQDTFLNVVGEEALIDAVRRCWASLWTDRVTAYRHDRGMDSGEAEKVRIAVVVQSMVDAEVAGVMFTANPVTGDRGHVVIDASGGLGEAVVSGLVTPDHYVLDSRAKLLDWSPGRHEFVVTSAAGGGVTHEAREAGETGSAAAQERLVPDAVLTELVRLAGEVASHFGRPQDIEWAYAEGRVRLLQARPMTALPPPPLTLNSFQRRLGSVLVEYLPVRPYPIDMTTWVPYGPAGLMGEVTAHFGIHRTFEGFLPEVDGVVDRLVPPTPHPTVGVLRAPYRLATLARKYDPARWTEDRRFADYLARIRELDDRDMTAMPWRELIGTPRRSLGLVQPIADLRIAYLPRLGLALVRLLTLLAPLRRAGLLSELITGAPTRTGDANRALEALAERARANPELQRAVDALDFDRLPEFADFHAEFEWFLAEYGHRETASPLLVTPPTLGESPETVLGLVKVLADGTPAHDDIAETPDQSAAAMTRLLEHPLLRGRRQRARITRWVETARAGMAFREDSHFYFTMPLPVLRRSLLEIGGRLHDAGVLRQPTAVFHLRLEELEEIADPYSCTEQDVRELRGLVSARSAKREELSGVPLIDPGLVFASAGSSADDALVSGAPGGGGVATGPVKVIREAAEFENLATGDVLVCPYTNPSWTPLFRRAAAVVVDSGGPASHAAIVAREYGISAVMGTGKGTDVLVDGQMVTVNGSTGHVTPGGA